MTTISKEQLHNLPLADLENLFFCSAEEGHNENLRAILDSKRITVNHQCSEHGRTALYYAASEGQESIIRLLREEYNADLNTRENHFGQSALHVAADTGRVDIVNLLLGYNAEIFKNALGESPGKIASTRLKEDGLWSWTDLERKFRHKQLEESFNLDKTLSPEEKDKYYDSLPPETRDKLQTNARSQTKLELRGNYDELIKIFRKYQEKNNIHLFPNAPHNAHLIQTSIDLKSSIIPE